jgi:peptidoglycan/xylan/chitin deacetylase (PgdA/CDA1 family)
MHYSSILKSSIVNLHEVNSKYWLEMFFKLLKKNYSLISIDELDDLYYTNKKVSNFCHITFDDGHNSFYEIAFPLIKLYNIPVSLYISPLSATQKINFWFQEISGYDENMLKKLINEVLNFPFVKHKTIPTITYLKMLPVDLIWEIIVRYQNVTKTSRKPFLNMNMDQIKEVNKSDLVTIGAHSLTHPILSNESNNRAIKEINESIAGLEEILKIKIKYFAYPNGYPDLDFGEREIRILYNVGIRLAFSTEKKMIDVCDNPLCIPRIVTNQGHKNIILLKLIMGNHWAKLRSLIPLQEEKKIRIRLSHILKEKGY